ncbi:uncharacterized protein A4U43_UnF8620 [Asparagus officinalis]|uniref:Uncharacterized protein n=1 Tax=Asparagus officinalis TaxID=4686 RepID=A0A1R3L5W6_ASPOF|nr:uncharacterized protein A4U43_UnF8620 [Asparagus officinalis]
MHIFDMPRRSLSYLIPESKELMCTTLSMVMQLRKNVLLPPIELLSLIARFAQTEFGSYEKASDEDTNEGLDNDANPSSSSEKPNSPLSDVPSSNSPLAHAFDEAA